MLNKEAIFDAMLLVYVPTSHICSLKQLFLCVTTIYNTEEIFWYSYQCIFRNGKMLCLGVSNMLALLFAVYYWVLHSLHES